MCHALRELEDRAGKGNGPAAPEFLLATSSHHSHHLHWQIHINYKDILTQLFHSFLSLNYEWVHLLRNPGKLGRESCTNKTKFSIHLESFCDVFEKAARACVPSSILCFTLHRPSRARVGTKNSIQAAGAQWLESSQEALCATWQTYKAIKWGLFWITVYLCNSPTAVPASLFLICRLMLLSPFLPQCLCYYLYPKCISLPSPICWSGPSSKSLLTPQTPQAFLL